jgi:TonB family protein
VLAVRDLLKLSSDQIAQPAESGGGTRRDVYHAPEVATGSVTQAGDLWSVGATLVTALTQSEPSGEETSRGEPMLPAGIPEPFRGIARECLRLDPKRRCSVADIKARLQPAARSVPVEHEPAPSREPRKRRWPVAAGLIAVVLAIGVAVFHSRGKNATAPSVAEQTAPQAEPAPAQAAPKPSPRASTAKTPAPAIPARKPDAPKPAPGSQGEVVHQVMPEFPQSARNTITGTIKIAVRVDVDPSGKVTAAKLTSVGPSEYFANLVLQASRGWEFSAPEVNGQPAASAWNLRFRLKRSGTQVTPERATH